MKKHTVFLLGKLTYLTDSEDKAVAFAEKDLKFLHPKYNMEVSGLMAIDDMEEE